MKGNLAAVVRETQEDQPWTVSLERRPFLEITKRNEHTTEAFR